MDDFLLFQMNQSLDDLMQVSQGLVLGKWSFSFQVIFQITLREVFSDEVENVVLLEYLQAVDNLLVLENLMDLELVLHKLGCFLVWVQIEIDNFHCHLEPIRESEPFVDLAVAPNTYERVGVILVPADSTFLSKLNCTRRPHPQYNNRSVDRPSLESDKF